MSPSAPAANDARARAGGTASVPPSTTALRGSRGGRYYAAVSEANASRLAPMKRVSVRASGAADALLGQAYERYAIARLPTAATAREGAVVVALRRGAVRRLAATARRTRRAPGFRPAVEQRAVAARTGEARSTW